MGQQTDSEIDDFHIYASNLLKTAETRVLKHGGMFGVFNVAGDIETYGSGVKGLYLDDTRHLDHLELSLNGKRPILLSSTIKQNNLLMTADLTNPEYEYGEAVVPDDRLHILRSKFLFDNTCYESLEIHNFGWDRPSPLRLSFRFDADFRDMFEIRGHERPERGDRHTPTVEDDQIEFAYTGLDDQVRRTRIGFSRPPDELTPGRAEFDLQLSCGHSTRIDYAVACSSRPADETSSTAPVSVHFDASFDDLAEERQTVTTGRCSIRSSNNRFDNWISRSRSDLFMLNVETEWGPYPHAGTPWFNTKFGRDGILTAYEILPFDPTIARGVLGYLADTQATEVDPANDAEPGKILHETRRGEAAAIGHVPFARYYGSVDSTPLFVWLAGEYLRRTDDREFIESIWPSIRAAINWIEEYGDVDGDGFVEYARKTEQGLVQQGWKDSHDSIFHADGRSAEGPIALCEVQAYVYGARRAAASMARSLGHTEFAAEQNRKAHELREAFEQTFWSDNINMYVLALDGDNHQCEVRSSNAGHCLLFDMVSPERAEIVVDQLTSRSFFSKWGIRTIASTEARYNPMSYHNGSIWPHDNALVARGMANYGYYREALDVFQALFDATEYFELQRLPELFCGIQRRTGEGPTQYPVACSPQAWAAGTVYLLLASLLDVRIDARRAALEFHEPMLPPSIDNLRIRWLRIGPSVLDLRLRRYPEDVGVEVLRRHGPVDIRVIK